MLLSRHPHGPWKFNEATAQTFRELHDDSWTQAGTLFGAAAAAVPDPRPRYVEDIKQHVRTALQQQASFTVADRMDLVLSDDLQGLAGPPEVREALQQLHDAGLIAGDRPKANRLEDYVVRRGPQLA